MNIFIISNLKFCFWHLDPLTGTFFCLVFPLYFLGVVHFSYNGSDWYFWSDIACLIYCCCFCCLKHFKWYTIGTLPTDFPVSFSGVCLCYCLFVLWFKTMFRRSILTKLTEKSLQKTVYRYLFLCNIFSSSSSITKCWTRLKVI